MTMAVTRTIETRDLIVVSFAWTGAPKRNYNDLRFPQANACNAQYPLYMDG
jgi:hypothetical protein